MRRISASIVMYKNAEETYESIKSVAENTKDKDFRLYLIDNNSPDGAMEILLQKKLPDCVVPLSQKENKGFGSGHNTVLEQLDSKYHAVINPDIALTEDSLGIIANWMDENPDVAIVTPRLLFPDKKEQFVAKRRPAILPLLSRQLNFGFLKKYEKHYLMQDEDLTKTQDIEFCSGCFFVIRTEIYKQMGGFDQGYFMYVEDADITQKALEYGRAVYFPETAVIHSWHREAHKSAKHFVLQLKSMLRYFGKWGWRWE